MNSVPVLPPMPTPTLPCVYVSAHPTQQGGKKVSEKERLVQPLPVTILHLICPLIVVV